MINFSLSKRGRDKIAAQVKSGGEYISLPLQVKNLGRRLEIITQMGYKVERESDAGGLKTGDVVVMTANKVRVYVTDMGDFIHLQMVGMPVAEQIVQAINHEQEFKEWEGMRIKHVLLENEQLHQVRFYLEDDQGKQRVFHCYIMMNAHDHDAPTQSDGTEPPLTPIDVIRKHDQVMKVIKASQSLEQRQAMIEELGYRIVRHPSTRRSNPLVGDIMQVANNRYLMFVSELGDAVDIS